MGSLRARGFTLFEIVVVLALIVIMVGAMAPSLSGYEGVSARHEGRRLVALLAAARAQAIVTGVPYRVDFRPRGYAFLTLDRRGRFRVVKARILRARRLPLGVTLVLLRARRMVMFSPSGLSQPFRIEIVGNSGRFVVTGDSNGDINGSVRS
ncbi:MAG TPA: GspH/FimT family pseudopilin [Acidiferrobacter sp.]|nr:GspH/FimT family pseudopilin [Acidiferrobacter sp.]